MAWSAWMSALNDVLADLYPTIDESRLIVTRVGMRPSLIRFDPGSLVNWFNILSAADKAQGNRPGVPPMARAILEHALSQYPDHEILQALARGLERGEQPVEAPRIDKMPWMVPPEEAEQLEKITGSQSTLLPINFLEIGMWRARSVARIVRKDGTSGTGFLVGGSWMLTNNHVFPAAEKTQGAEAQFNYQLTVDGLDAPMKKYPFDAARFHTSKADDWTLIGIDPAADGEWGTIELGRVATTVGAFVNIIQHPAGGPKQIGLYHNTVAYVGEGRVQYLTDTLPGSSGAPVFNDQWQVVALHHSGGMLREPGTKNKFYRNEGIAIATVLDGLAASGVTVPSTP